MPQKKSGAKRKPRKGVVRDDKRELMFKEDGQSYALVTNLLGNGRLEAACTDGRTRLAVIRGTMRRRVWIARGDLILVGLRDFQDAKADVIFKYTADEARQLKQYGEIPAHVRINDTSVQEERDGEGADDDYVAFEDVDAI